MYIVFQQLHSYLAWVFLLILIYIIAAAILLMIRKKPFSETFRKSALAGFIISHLQLIIGILLYVVSPFGFFSFSGEAMSDSVMRLYLVEHPLTMIIGIVFISFGYIKAKKPGDDVRRFRTIILFYTAGLLFFLIRIPWHTWPF